MKRWTKTELENIGDITFAVCVLLERKSALKNQHSNLAAKIDSTIRTLESIEEEDWDEQN